MLYPLTFQPIFMERVWGGRNLERLYAKSLPPHLAIGESWEMTCRPEAVSVVANGPLAGRDLRWLMRHHDADLLGRPNTAGQRFPLLLKILDAEQKLSLQVHPSASVAPQLGGEPKTELWYVAHAAPEAMIYAGLRQGVTRAQFEQRIRDGTVADCFHSIAVRSGDVMFLPSGRVHALGAGNVIFEIQQNSDTTYRVFDWNRVGLDGKPRDLHIDESLACVDFNDFEPALVDSPWFDDPSHTSSRRRALTRNPLFHVDVVRAESAGSVDQPGGQCRILALIDGSLAAEANGQVADLRPGGFCLLAASLDPVRIRWPAPVMFLEIRYECGI